jgi:hypothetical protein
MFPQVLRSNSLLESTDYWLQNQRTPCQIGFVEDESENCASVSVWNSGARWGWEMLSSNVETGTIYNNFLITRLGKYTFENMFSCGQTTQS